MNGKAYKKAELLDAGPYPVLRVGNFFTNNHWYYSDLELDEDKYCDDGDLLYAWSASFGPRIWNGGKVIYHYHIWKVLPVTTKLNSNFLYYFFDWDKEAIKREQGAGATMIHVSKGSMEARSIPLPPLEEQRRIVAVLDEAFEGLDRARANTEANLQNARELFSIIKENGLQPSGAEVQEVVLSEVAEISSGLVDPREGQYANMLHIGAGNMISESDELIDVKTAHEEKLKSSKYTFDPSMVLYSKIRPYLMKACRPDFEGICSADVYPLTPNPIRLDKNYLFHLLLSRSFTEYAIEGSARAGMPKVNRSHLFAFRFKLPPLNIQKEICKKIDDIQSSHQVLQENYHKQLGGLENLRQSILQKAFSGELTTSKPHTPCTPANDNEALSEFVIALAYSRHQTAGQERTFGHVKTQKILSLTESLCKIDLGREPTRQRAGPNDMPHMNRMEDRAAKQQAFKFRERPGGYTFKTLSAFDSTVREAQHKLTPIMPALNKLIELVVNMDTQETEVLATVHAAWNNLIIDNAEIDNEAIVRAAREDWHPDKMDIARPLFFKAIATIKSNGIEPDGTAKYVPAMQESLF